MKHDRMTIPEWAEQDAVQLTWPHADSDWDYILDDVRETFLNLAKAITRYENLIIVCQDVADVRRQIEQQHVDMSRVTLLEIDSNDTWARDHGAITIKRDGDLHVMDFVFNGWGMKFAADRDNLISRRMHEQQTFAANVDFESVPFVLEGGGVEFDGRGTMLTTASCIYSLNRNEAYSHAEIDARLKAYFGVDRILVLNHGALAGDDTDGHVDTLARLCTEDTIAYVSCTDKEDEHYDDLKAMESELQTLRTPDGKPYKLVPLPMPRSIVMDGERLPATYANFLIINGAVLLPVYGQADKDAEAVEALKRVFVGREIVPVNCVTLIRQHGSLHCVTMQYPKGTIRQN